MRFKRPEEYTGQEYAKLPEEFVRKLRARWGKDARATTPNGAPFPLRSWPPDAAIDIQNLATWADTTSSVPFGRLTWTSVNTSLSSGIAKVTTNPTANYMRSGCAVSAASGIAAGTAGLYRVTGFIDFGGLGTSVGRAYVGNTSSVGYWGATLGMGTYGAPRSDGQLQSLFDDVIPLTAGEAVFLWREAGVSCTMRHAGLMIQRIREQ